MLYELIDKLKNKTYTTMKWLLTAVSGVITTGLIVFLET